MSKMEVPAEQKRLINEALKPVARHGLTLKAMAKVSERGQGATDEGPWGTLSYNALPARSPAMLSCHALLPRPPAAPSCCVLLPLRRQSSTCHPPSSRDPDPASHPTRTRVRAHAQAVESGKPETVDLVKVTEALVAIEAAVAKVKTMLAQTTILADACHELAAVVRAGTANWPANADGLPTVIPIALRSLMDAVRTCLEFTFDVRPVADYQMSAPAHPINTVKLPPASCPPRPWSLARASIPSLPSRRSPRAMSARCRSPRTRWRPTCPSLACGSTPRTEPRARSCTRPCRPSSTCPR